MNPITQKLVDRMNSVKFNKELQEFLDSKLWKHDDPLHMTFKGNMDEFVNDLIGLGYLNFTESIDFFKDNGGDSLWDDYFFDVIVETNFKNERYLKNELFTVKAHDCVTIWNHESGREKKIFIKFI